VASIEFGVALPSVRGVGEFARLAERLGYDYLTCGEHVMFHGPVSNSLIALSVAAGATEKIKLMSSIVLLPLYNPVMLAKQTAVLDVASDGRYHMGVGIGGEFPKEFEACGVPVKQRGSRSNEALELIRKLWTEKNVSFEGRYTRFSGVTLEPAPVQKPHPPIWVGGASDAALRRAELGVLRRPHREARRHRDEGRRRGVQRRSLLRSDDDRARAHRARIQLPLR